MTTKINYRIEKVPIDKIISGKYQPRDNDSIDEDIDDLTESIKQTGLVNNIIVRELEDGTCEIVAGHRRFAALKKIGATTITVQIISDIDDKELATISFTDNFHRKDLSHVEQAKFIKKSIDEFGWTEKKVAEKLNMKLSVVSERLSLLKLPEYMISDIDKGINYSQGLQLSKLSSGESFNKAEEQSAIYKKISAHGLKKEETVELVRVVKDENYDLLPDIFRERLFDDVAITSRHARLLLYPELFVEKNKGEKVYLTSEQREKVAKHIIGYRLNFEDSKKYLEEFLLGEKDPEAKLPTWEKVNEIIDKAIEIIRYSMYRLNDFKKDTTSCSQFSNKLKILSQVIQEFEIVDTKGGIENGNS